MACPVVWSKTESSCSYEPINLESGALPPLRGIIPPFRADLEANQIANALGFANLKETQTICYGTGRGRSRETGGKRCP